MLLIPPVSIKNKINIGHSNEFLTNASLHCSSTPTPEPTPTPTPEPTLKPNPATTAPKIVAKPKSVSPKTIKAAKKKYCVRIRTYKIVNGKKVYSAWSKVKSVKTK